MTKGADSPRYNPCQRNDGRCRGERLGNMLVSNSGDTSHKNRLVQYILSVDCADQEETTTTMDPSTRTTTTTSTTTENPNSGKRMHNDIFLLTFTLVWCMMMMH